MKRMKFIQTHMTCSYAFVVTCILLFSVFFNSKAQESTIPVTDNLVIEGIPALPSSYITEVKNYTEARAASLVSWHPLKKEMLISTRFANSNQIHYVRMPGGAREQITFFDEPITEATFEPREGNYFLFLKDIGGNEFDQIYRFDLLDKKITLLTDGKSQNGGIRWSKKGDKIAYGSTRRNGQDRDIYILDPMKPDSEKKLVENAGGGWWVVDWSPDDSKLLIEEYISVNESRLYEVDVVTGNKTRMLPLNDERSAFHGIAYSKDGKGIYLITNKENEFNRLAFYNFTVKNVQYITTPISWDVENADISKDGARLAFITNENGMSKLYMLETDKNTYEAVPNVPVGVIGGILWSGDSKSLGINLNNYSAPGDVYVFEMANSELLRWTFSELGGMEISKLKEPELISWKSFDSKNISGYLYRAASSFSGKRPVIINIHGGPESQFTPGFIGRSNYYLNEMGISIIYPNVRGSSGYGKTFVDLDNGLKREESVKDIGTLIDWIATQPDLDKDRIMVIGGSYGGYMTLAASFHYSDKIRCAIDIVGISNFNTFLKNTEAYRRDLRRVEYGDERDPKIAAFLRKLPLQIKRIRSESPSSLFREETILEFLQQNRSK